jgi:hypothetical protein
MWNLEWRKVKKQDDVRKMERKCEKRWIANGERNKEKRMLW